MKSGRPPLEPRIAELERQMVEVKRLVYELSHMSLPGKITCASGPLSGDAKLSDQLSAMIQGRR